MLRNRPRERFAGVLDLIRIEPTYRIRFDTAEPLLSVLLSALAAIAGTAEKMKTPVNASTARRPMARFVMAVSPKCQGPTGIHPSARDAAAMTANGQNRETFGSAQGKNLAGNAQCGGSFLARACANSVELDETGSAA